MRARAYLGLGGNIGDPRANMRAALQTIDARQDTSIVEVSRLYRTPPWGKIDQPWFVNAAATVETELPPVALLDLCLATERGLKRERVERWGPRTIDLDVLAYAGIEFHDERLTLPHPRIAERAFVLVPLGDIAPDLAIQGVSVTERLRRIDRAGIEPASEGGEWWRDRARDEPGGDSGLAASPR